MKQRAFGRVGAVVLISLVISSPGVAKRRSAPTAKYSHSQVSAKFRGRAGTTVKGTLTLMPTVSGGLWVETRAAILREKSLSLIGGESIQIGRSPYRLPAAGPIIDLGPVEAGDPVELSVEIEIARGVIPGAYETQVNWAVRPEAPNRLDENPMPITIEIDPPG
jgi:hypothetical protein